MRFTFAASVILAAVLAFIAPINSSNSTSAQTDCVQALTYDLFASDGSFVGRWIDDDSLDCASVHRPADEDAPRDGIYLARYYTFSMSEAADVAITLESPIDTYLYLLEGKGTDGAVLHKNDDIDYEADNLNSRIRETLQSGDYTIEATTYDAVYPTPVIEFRLTTSGITLQPSADDDRTALTALYHATDGDNWRNNTNWLTNAPLDDWHGVTTNSDGRVTGLELTYNDMHGEIPPEIAKLANLETLDLGGNDSLGELPAELGELTNLVTLDLWNNNLTGEIPPELGNLTNLETLYLLSNELTGEIPAELGQLNNLETLHLGENQLTGSIPPQLGNLSDLWSLLLFENELTGEIPPDLGELSELNRLWLYTNQLTGEMPPELGNLSNLVELHLYENQLTGSIPPELGNLGNPSELHLRDNNLTGDIPPELGNLTRLRYIFLSSNNLTGQIPRELGNLSNLDALGLGGNNLTGEIPPELADIKTLGALWIRDNDLTAESFLPRLGELTNLVHLDIGGNQIRGADVLPHISALPELWELGLHDSQLTTEELLPYLSVLSNLGQLRELKLNDNQLTGELMLSQFANFSALHTLDVHNNQLTGRIPPQLGGGSSAFDKLYIDLSRNRLTGSVPPELGNAEDLEYLVISNNHLTDELPHSLTDLNYLETFRFHNNAGLCAPADATFQEWLQSINNVRGDNCEDDQPPTPTLPACVESLPSDMTVSDTWNTDCTSNIDAPSGSGDRYARFFTFTLDAESDVTIDLSSDKDTYLYLRSGASTDGTVTHENDDRATDNYDSMIEERLDSGTYTVEATTYAAGVTGSFTLAVTVVPVPDTTELEPPPDPTTLIPESCALQSFSGTSVNDSWTSDCVSQNRTENGAHYAKFFSFSVSRSATYDITLVSRTDPYLILLDSAGDIIDSDDDDDNGLFNLGSRNSGIRIALDPGDYIFEATTHAGSATGDFTLTILRP